MTDSPNQDLARQVKAWRGSVPKSLAAARLGIPYRTYERIEFGNGFRYPLLLLHVITTMTVEGALVKDLHALPTERLQNMHALITEQPNGDPELVRLALRIRAELAHRLNQEESK